MLSINKFQSYVIILQNHRLIFKDLETDYIVSLGDNLISNSLY